MNNTRRNRIITAVMLVLMVISMTGAYAGSLWNKAEDIVEDTNSLVPSLTQISYGETNGYGVVLTEDEAVIIHGENQNGSLTRREIGEDDIFSVISTFTDGLPFTPFAEAAEDLDYEKTGNRMTIDGEDALEYYFELSIDANMIKYDTSVERDYDIEVEGVLWIAEDDGRVLQVEQYYSLYNNYTGSLDIEQEITFGYEGEVWVPVETFTKGKQIFTNTNKTEERIDFILTEAYSGYFEASTYER